MNLLSPLKRLLFGKKEQILFRHDHEEIAALLFSQAAHAHKAGDSSKAIATFQVAVSLYNQANERVPLDYQLRLPIYLAALDRRHDAWEAYRQLLASYAAYEETQRPTILARIYDKMRLFQQRASQFDRALVYSALAYVAWNQGLERQMRLKELTNWSQRANIEYGLRLSLGKASEPTRQAVIHCIMQTPLTALDLEHFETKLMAFT